MDANKPKRKATYKMVFVLIFEPFLFGFTLFILFTHVQSIVNTAKSLTISGLGRAFMIDVGMYALTVWVPVFIVLAFWVTMRIFIYKWDKEESRKEKGELHQLIKNNTTVMKQVLAALKKLNRVTTKNE